jgi:hypothetical protein
MIELVITQQQRDRAQQRLTDIRLDPTRGLSLFGSEGWRILFGYLGEEMVLAWLEMTDLNEIRETFEYDLVFRGKRLEVKTISCKFRPHLDYLCTVNSYDLSGVHQQEADFYVFVRILNDQSKGWLLGYYPCKEFFEKGRFVPKGTEMKNFAFEKANATVMEIYNLLPMDSLRSLPKP